MHTASVLLTLLMVVGLVTAAHQCDPIPAKDGAEYVKNKWPSNDEKHTSQYYWENGDNAYDSGRDIKKELKHIKCIDTVTRQPIGFYAYHPHGGANSVILDVLVAVNVRSGAGSIMLGDLAMRAGNSEHKVHVIILSSPSAWTFYNSIDGLSCDLERSAATSTGTFVGHKYQGVLTADPVTALIKRRPYILKNPDCGDCYRIKDWLCITNDAASDFLQVVGELGAYEESGLQVASLTSCHQGILDFTPRQLLKYLGRWADTYEKTFVDSDSTKFVEASATVHVGSNTGLMHNRNHNRNTNIRTRMRSRNQPNPAMCKKKRPFKYTPHTNVHGPDLS